MRLRHADGVVDLLDKALAKQGMSLPSLQVWKENMPREEEMLPKDKYSIFDRKEKRYRKGIHSAYLPPYIVAVALVVTWSVVFADVVAQNCQSGQESARESTLLDTKKRHTGAIWRMACTILAVGYDARTFFPMRRILELPSLSTCINDFTARVTTAWGQSAACLSEEQVDIYCECNDFERPGPDRVGTTQFRSAVKPCLATMQAGWATYNHREDRADDMVPESI